jgi:hypothetical protein
MRRRSVLRPELESMEAMTLLSSLPLYAHASTVGHTDSLKNTAIELVKVDLSGKTFSGQIDGAINKGATSGVIKKTTEWTYRLRLVGKFSSGGTLTGHVHGLIQYKVTTDVGAAPETQHLKFDQATLEFDYVNSSIDRITGDGLKFKLTIPHNLKKLPLASVQTFDYKITGDTGYVGSTPKTGTIVFQSLWPAGHQAPTSDLRGATQNQAVSGTFGP